MTAFTSLDVENESVAAFGTLPEPARDYVLTDEALNEAIDTATAPLRMLGVVAKRSAELRTLVPQFFEGRDVAADDNGREHWRRDAACASSDVNVEWFFQQGKQNEVKAKEVCATCPQATKSACLFWATNLREYGVWGGTNRNERERLRDALKDLDFPLVALRTNDELELI